MMTKMISPYTLGFLSFLGDGKYCNGNPIVVKPADMPEGVFDAVCMELEGYCVEEGKDCFVLDKDKFFSAASSSYAVLDGNGFWSYAAGAFDRQDQTMVVHWDREEILVFKSKNPMLESYIARFCPVSFVDDGLVYRFKASNFIDFLCQMSANAPGATPSGLVQNPQLVLKFAKCHKDAVIPFKKRPSDSGYDVVVVEKLKETQLGVQYWHTGIKCETPAGWYLDMVPRSSLSKKGYTITNCVGIIDQSYKGEIVVVVHKTRDHTIEIEPGDRIAQLIPRETKHFRVIEIKESDLIATERQEKGFGSSGQK